MEVDERLIKQLVQLAIENDIERHIDEIRDFYDKLIDVSLYKKGANASEEKENKKWAYNRVARELLIIRERLIRVKEKIENAKLAPECKKSFDREVKRCQKTYDAWAAKCKEVLRDWDDELLKEL